jgi:hypothetical protein
LDFLLSADFPGAEEIRRQALAVRALDTWGDEATIDLVVDKRQAAPVHVREPIPVEARSRDEKPLRELILHVREGWLTTLELVQYDEPQLLQVFPSPREFYPPWWNEASYRASQENEPPESR